MKNVFGFLLILSVFALGCGGTEQAEPEVEEPAEEVVELQVDNSGKSVADPCALLTVEEAATLGGTVDTPVEGEVAWDNIRQCTWNADHEGFYGVIITVVDGGLDKAKEIMMLGEEQAIEGLEMPGFFEMIMGGVGSVAVENDGVAVYVSPVWTSRPAVDSEKTSVLVEVAKMAASRL